MNEVPISQEYVISEHYFVYVVKGLMNLFDGSEHQVLRSGECCIARKNRLGRFNKLKENNELEKVIIALDEQFLKGFQEKYQKAAVQFDKQQTFFKLESNKKLPDFIHSLKPYYSHGELMKPFSDLKREELVLILLQNQPELAGIFFDYGIPQKINLEEYMNRNYKFNVDLEHFAFLTGRSLSSFKRDFKQVFNETPHRWILQKRLSEAYFLIDQKNRKPSEIYLDLGFETLAHFSVTFKKQFQLTPTDLAEQKRNFLQGIDDESVI